MLSLLRIVESYGTDGQYYDLGKDFAAFRRMIDGADQKIRQQYEQAIGSRLIGKRVRARASRGYKQYVKDYEFDVAKITVDDYYDNFVVVAHDTTTPKAKEYFLKPGFKVQIIGPATGQPSPQKGNKPGDMQPRVPKPVQQQPAVSADQHKPMSLAPAGRTPTEEPVKEVEEKGTGFYDAYPIDQIGQDIKPWLPKILLKPETALRDFIKGLGWQKQISKGTTVALFDLKIPADSVKPNIGVEMVKQMVTQMGKEGSPIQTKYDLVKMEPDDAKGEWNLRIKKTTSDRSV